MKNTYLILSLIFVFLFSNVSLAEDSSNVAKVILMRGQATAKLKDGKEMNLAIDQSIPEGAEINTSPKSFVKLIFIDKSVMNLGPSSSIVIRNFPKNEAGIINLLKGQIRSEVTKNYMEMSDKSKSKLYIQTKSAAMGIRGTDFQVNYNPANQNSALIVFEGKVVMSHIDRANQNDSFNQVKLEQLVSNNTAVLVKQGQISAVNLNISDRALVPTKLAPKQLDALKENTTGVDDESKNKKKTRDIVPPGVDRDSFINAQPELVKKEVAEAKGFFNEKTHEFKPNAGSIIDLKTVNIITPPPEAQFDHASKTFIIPETFGRIDDRSGEFKAPKGFELSNEGQFQAVVKEPIKNQPLAVAKEVMNIPTANMGTVGLPPADSASGIAPVKMPTSITPNAGSTVLNPPPPTVITTVAAPATLTTVAPPPVLTIVSPTVIVPIKTPILNTTIVQPAITPTSTSNTAPAAGNIATPIKPAIITTPPVLVNPTQLPAI